MTRRDPGLRRPPSFVAGFALAWRLRVLVGVLWVVHHLLMAPVWGVAVSTFGGPSAPRLDPEMAEGEWLVVALELARPVVWPMALAVVSTCVVWWVWTVLWRAGVVTWSVWGTPGRPRIAEILGHGVVRWWRFARLHFVAAMSVGVMVVGVGILTVSRIDVVARVAADGQVLGWAVIGIVAWLTSLVLVGAVVAASCWRMGSPGVDSTLRAAGQGVVVVARHPVRAAMVTLGWWVIAALLATGPVSFAVHGVSSTLTVVVLEACLLARAACRVAHLGSFLPVLGIDSEVARSK